MDFELARFNMVEQQIRPWNVLDQSVLDLLFAVKREDFVSPSLRAMAFSDLELPILINGRNSGEHMLPPKLEARLLQELAIKGFESALEIGTGTGYVAALLGQKAGRVVSAEIEPTLAALATQNLSHAGIANVEVIQADGVNGLPSAGQFDAIMVSGSMPMLPKGLLGQLKVHGRLVAIVGQGPVMEAKLVSRLSDSEFVTKILFETNTSPLKNAPQLAQFCF